MKSINSSLRRASILTLAILLLLLVGSCGNAAWASSIDESQSQREIFYDTVDRAIQTDASAPQHYAGHWVSQDNAKVHLNWVFDMPKEKVGNEEKQALIAQLGLKELPIIVAPQDYTIVQLNQITRALDKVIGNADEPVYEIMGFGAYILIYCVQVTLAPPFEENRKAFRENVSDVDAIVFRVAGTETGVDQMDLPRRADELPLPVFAAGAKARFAWKENPEAVRYRYDIVDCREKTIVKSVYTKENEGFLPAGLEEGTYKITVLALDAHSRLSEAYSAILHAGTVAVLPKDKIDPSRFAFDPESQRGYALGRERAETFLPYYDVEGKIVFLPEAL